jgi:MULE transposase domain
MTTEHKNLPNNTSISHFINMTSTIQLSVGAKISKTNLKATWLKFNHDSGYDVKVVQNIETPKCRYFSVCYSAPKTGWKSATDACRAHVKAVGDNEAEMSITSLNLSHTCGRDDDNKRKRNYRTRDICSVSNVLQVYQPAKSGNAKQFAKMTKTATGVSLKHGQANLAIKACIDDTIQAFIGQYFWLPSLLTAYKESDPDGSFVLEFHDCDWNENLNQFYRCYVCLSISKHFWSRAGIRLLVCDGTHTRNNCFKHIVLIATSYDANNQIVILAFAIVEVENAESWVWFKEQLELDFADIEVWMSDADKGIRSNAFSMSMSQSTSAAFQLSRCARHLAENCRENCRGTMNETHNGMIVELAKSMTEEVYSRRLEAIRAINEEWAGYLDRHKHEYVCCFFGRRRWGKVTSNGVESINGVLGEARSLPIVYLIEHIVKYQREKYHERYLMACRLSMDGQLISDYCRDIQVRLGDEASKRNVEVIERNHPEYRARVQTQYNAPVVGYLEVYVHLDRRVSKCPCQYFDEMGISCSHVKALLLTLNRQSTWCASRYSVTTYKDCYSAEIPSMVVAGKLSVDDTLAPPDFKRPAGRPAKKRKDRSYLRKTNVQRECQACGQLGHYARGCTAPDTEYRFNRYRDSAIAWCEAAQARASL